jgi:phosphatidylserine/phosphatidylglycerophosphate/cardiolipin synthase-like enzyme
MVGSLSVSGDCNLEAIRCVGNHNSAKKPAFPRMHHKFLVFCSASRSSNRRGQSQILPLRVWTGSFNLTENSTNSLENAVLVNSHLLAKAYFEEWQQIAALSEQLDWTSDWMTPEWRIGT